MGVIYMTNMLFQSSVANIPFIIMTLLQTTDYYHDVCKMT
jgi:hypothetical protein